MALEEEEVKVGGRVIISRPRPNGTLGARIERISTVSAVRLKSFDAGGLCFRMDGREWGGHNRARMSSTEEEAISDSSLTSNPGSSDSERAGRAKEDVILAFLLSTRHEKDWLKLGLPELRRIAALHGIPSARTGVVPVSNSNARE
jgi:hypothetical protein